MSRGLSVLRLTFLGTSAAAPTATRNVSGLALKADSDLYLFDCGEGSQRQMIRFGTGFKLRGIFFTHFHADHYLGVIGLIRTLGMLGRGEPLHLYGPPPATTLLQKAILLGTDVLDFEVKIHDVEEGVVLKEDHYEVAASKVDHRISSVCYAFREESRPGTFDVERAKALGLTPGPDFRRLQQGETVGNVRPSDVLGPAIPGRHIVVSGDTRPCEATVNAARDADILIHEATFSDAEQERAVETRHSTAREAAGVAKQAGAKRLILTHLSARFEENNEVLLSEARAAYDGPLEIASDGLVVDVPLRHPASGER